MGEGARQHQKQGDARYEWVSPDESVREPFSSDQTDAVSLASQYDLAISGEGLGHLHDIGAENIFVPMTQVGVVPSHVGFLLFLLHALKALNEYSL